MIQLRKFAATFAVVGSVTLVMFLGVVTGLAPRHRSVPQPLETIVRNSGKFLPLVVVPLLSAVVYRSWARSYRDASFWRNAMGLFAMIIPVLGWLMLATESVLRATNHSTELLGFAIIVSGYLNFLAAVFAIGALRGHLRFLAVAPPLLILAWIQSGIFI